MTQRKPYLRLCSWCIPCSASFCDCGPCADTACKTCHPCKDCKQVETGVEHCGIKEMMTEPCEACVSNFSHTNWEDSDSEGAGGDQ